MAALPKPKQESEGTAFSVLHGGTVYDQETLWPWSKAVFDPMHGMHYEGNVLLDESVQPLAAAEDLDPAAKADVLQATEEINTLWRGYNFPKYIQFGKDGAGSRFKHLDGPTWKGALRSNVLKKTYEIMREKVYTRCSRCGRARGKPLPSPPRSRMSWSKAAGARARRRRRR